MPSALETLVKILKLEREQGYKNTAVIGGLASFGEKWAADAHAQAKKPEHHGLVDELSVLLHKYEQLDNRNDRHTSVTYMLDRITGRVPPPPEYRAPTEPAVTLPLDEKRPEREERHPHRERPKPPERRHERESQPRRAAERKPSHPPGRAAERHTPPPRREQPPKDEADEDERETASADISGLDFFEDDLSPRSRGRGEPRRGKGNGYKVIPAGELDIPPQPRLARPPRKPRPPMGPEEAADILRGLQAPATTVKGVGPHTARLLDKLGIYTINDMLFFLPRRYDDYTRLSYINRLKPAMIATVIGTVQSATIRVGKNNRKDFVVVIDDGSASMSVVFFGQPFRAREIKVGHQLVLSGRTSFYSSQIQMTNPEWEYVDPENLKTPGIVPVYPLTQGLSARTLRPLMKQTVNYWSQRLPDYVPETILERAELADLGWTVKNLHFPESMDHLQHAKKRLIFDELLLLQLAILGNRREWQSVPAQPLNVSDDFLESFIQTAFPYELTGAQQRAVADIRRDIASDKPMNRLIQGDVGSGKTAVAAVMMAMAFACGKQSALMAPTSILAEQHYRNISTVLEQTPGERRPVVGLLTSALTSTEREAIYAGLADGSIDMVIGTHALIQEGVEFKDLAAVIIDEQHRFGVGQRGALRGKGINPHVLVMTATPIPRTLALTLYADLDLSIIDEKPPGRQPVQTRVVEPVARERVYNFVETQLEKGRQAFIVHPLVEPSEKIDAVAATEAYEHLQKVFHRYRVGLLHGRMKPVEKEEVMAAFSAGKFDVLVTTSVAEVGVDVPNANIMVIEGANRFGLAQLHQFRGRVGRGEHKSYCLLIADVLLPGGRSSGADREELSEMQQRLKAMEETEDGFKLAEIDWKLRGAGELLGTRQSGQKMRLAEEMTPDLVELAQREARTLYEEDPYLGKPEHRLLAQRVTMLHNEDSDLS